jgi:hypothetical protein
MHRQNHNDKASQRLPVSSIRASVHPSRVKQFGEEWLGSEEHSCCDDVPAQEILGRHCRTTRQLYPRQPQRVCATCHGQMFI